MNFKIFLINGVYGRKNKTYCFHISVAEIYSINTSIHKITYLLYSSLTTQLYTGSFFTLQSTILKTNLLYNV